MPKPAMRRYRVRSLTPSNFAASATVSARLSASITCSAVGFASVMAAFCHCWQIRVNPYFDIPQICQRGNVADVNQLLALANGAALHKALLKEVPTAKYRTVARWVGAKRQQPPAEMVPAILRAFGIETEKEAPPPWARELTGELLDEIKENRRAVLEAIQANLAAELAKYGLERALDEQPHDEPTRGSGGSTPTGVARP